MLAGVHVCQHWLAAAPIALPDGCKGCGCRKVFEPFGGMKSAVIAARDNEPGDTRLKLAGFNGDQMTSDPDYDQPLVKELELVLVVFDILYCRGQVLSLPRALVQGQLRA